jgi:hypothetical protein
MSKEAFPTFLGMPPLGAIAKKRQQNHKKDKGLMGRERSL